jgi:predicted aminopeptidase
MFLVAVSGCNTITFYSQALKGQYQMFAHEKSAEKLIAAPQTPTELKQRLEYVRALRVFAADSLKLPVDGHYQKYADLGRPYVVWNVEAAPEFSLEPKAWWYPLVGSLEYRGFFAEPTARKYGTQLKKRGYDVYVGGVEAYSTLGWFKDPLLNTFIFNPDADLAETIFHELGHQRVFARGDTDFNEAFATTVGQEGARRWLRAKKDVAGAEEYEQELKRTREFVHLVMSTRGRLETLYGDERTEAGKIKATKKNRDVPPEKLRAEKEKVFAELRQSYAELKQSWGGDKSYDGWFGKQLNNAQLNSVAAYYDLLPGFERLLELQGGDLEKFYTEAEALAKKSKKERERWLRKMGELPRVVAGGEDSSTRSQEPEKLQGTSTNGL